MARNKNLNIIVSFEGTGCVINDFGESKSPRFELYHILDKKSIKKSDNPYDFYDYIYKIWKVDEENV